MCVCLHFLVRHLVCVYVYMSDSMCMCELVLVCVNVVLRLGRLCLCFSLPGRLSVVRVAVFLQFTNTIVSLRCLDSIFSRYFDRDKNGNRQLFEK